MSFAAVAPKDSKSLTSQFWWVIIIIIIIIITIITTRRRYSFPVVWCSNDDSPSMKWVRSAYVKHIALVAPALEVRKTGNSAGHLDLQLGLRISAGSGWKGQKSMLKTSGGSWKINHGLLDNNHLIKKVIDVDFPSDKLSAGSAQLAMWTQDCACLGPIFGGKLGSFWIFLIHAWVWLQYVNCIKRTTSVEPLKFTGLILAKFVDFISVLSSRINPFVTVTYVFISWFMRFLYLKSDRQTSDPCQAYPLVN